MLECKIGKKSIPANNKSVETAVVRFCQLKATAAALEEELSAHKQTIAEYAKNALLGEDGSTVTLSAGEKTRVKIAFGWDVKVSDVKMLSEILGDKFDLLVKTETVYKPEARLKEMALNDEGLAACLSIKEKPAAVTVAA